MTPSEQTAHEIVQFLNDHIDRVIPHEWYLRIVEIVRRGDSGEIPWEKLTPLMHTTCDGYGISNYPDENPSDTDFCEGSIVWLAVEAYKLGRAGQRSTVEG